MTTYTFVGNASQQFVSWNDPTVWTGGGFPNSTSADAVIPEITTSGGSIYHSFIGIAGGQSYSTNSVSITDNFLSVDGTLTVENGVSLTTGGEIDMAGTLSAGSLALEDGSTDVQGSGLVNISGMISNETSIIGNGLTVSAAAFTNDGTVEAASGNLTLTVSPGGFSNFSGSTLTGGTYSAGFERNTSPNILDLNVGGLIITDAANIQLDGGGSIQSFDSNSSEYVPIQSSLTTIAQNGTLSLSDQTYSWVNALIDDGALTLSNAGSLNAPQLTVGSNGTVSGTGTIVGTVNNAGVIIAGAEQSELLGLPTTPPENGVLEIDGSISGAGILQIGAPDFTSVGLGFGLHTAYSFPTLELDGPASANVIFPSFILPPPSTQGGSSNTIAAPPTLILNDPSGDTGSIDPGTGGDIVVPGVSYSSVTGYSYSGNTADGTLTVQETGGATVTLNFSGDLDTADFTLAAGPQALSSSPPSLSITVTPSPNPAPATNASADMILRRANGTYDIFDLGNNSILGAYYLGQLGSAWQAAGVGGFDGADTSDVMLRNSATGEFAVYLVDNNTASGPVTLGQVGLEWSVAGFGDFSGNIGETDMLLRNNNTGAFEIYDIKDDTITFAAPMGQVGLEWSVVGFGDFSGNANETDMLMRNGSTGAFEVYDINDNAITFATGMGQVDPAWSVAGFGDFSGNANETDMLMRNTNTGAFEIYDIADNRLGSFTSMGQVGLEWSVVGFGDFSGNADETDMLMRNSNTGAFYAFDIANDRLTAAAPMGAVGLDWSVAGIAADPPGVANAQLAQAMASYAPASAALSVTAPFDQPAATQPAAATLIAAAQISPNPA